MTISAPAIKVSQTTASERRSSGTEATAEPAVRAAALVVVITIILVLAVKPPATRPTKLAYRPWTGLTPASTPFAMPSGTAAMALGIAAAKSRLRSARRGLTSLAQPRTLATSAALLVGWGLTVDPVSSGMGEGMPTQSWVSASTHTVIARIKASS